MKLTFYKYHGTGNDFILINNFESKISLKIEQIAFLCHRNFGIGADGLMLLSKSENYDFEMEYYNSDGTGATMCGNGGRCIVAFAKHLGIIKNTTKFTASDGLHEAKIDEQNIVSLKMADVNEIQKLDSNKYFCNTGSPHFVSFENSVENIDVYTQGKAIRNSETYKNKGTNVNFVEQFDKQTIFVRTYERGVENETLSCGTGVVASAISFYKKHGGNNNFVDIKTKGGNLKVDFFEENNIFYKIFLTGPASFVFKGEIEI
jgi:diaminopimelate epimerase